MAGRNYGTYGSGRSGVPAPAGRYAQAAEFDPGIRAAASPPPEHSILRSGALRKNTRSRVNVWELILVPWAFLVLILVCYLLGGAHGKPIVLWIIPVVLIILSCGFVNYHYRTGNNAEVVLGILCITAVAIGLVVGMYSVFRSLKEFHRLSQGASYFNVLPSEPATGKRDATTLAFSRSTQVDPSRALGFVDAQMTITTTYCVAPVSNGDEGRRIQYWAAGINCCERRGNFQCGAATNPEAHSAVVLPEAKHELKGFKMAVKAAESAYGLTSGDQYLLVEWHPDPVGLRGSLWKNTTTFFLIFGGVYLVISTMIGCALMPVVVGAIGK